MPNYDFKQLSPHDFEQLTRDLIQARDDFILESFKTGRDLGIDRIFIVARIFADHNLAHAFGVEPGKHQVARRSINEECWVIHRVASKVTTLCPSSCITMTI